MGKSMSKKSNKGRTRFDEWKADQDYISYIVSGEAMAVYIVRDVENSIDTKGKWIDIISCSTYEKRGAKDYLEFNWIIVELFPRQLNPEYCEGNKAYNRYLTWRTAHEDIEHQRKNGYHGPKFLILCNLTNMNENKYRKRVVCIKKYWEPQEAYRDTVIKEPIEPKWEYEIQAVKKVNHKQIKYIEDHKSEIIFKIMANKDLPTLGILGIK